MTMLISLADIKMHLRLDDDPETDIDGSDAIDSQLEQMYNAAVDYCENYIGKPLVDSNNQSLNPSVRAAMLLVIGGLFENRESNFVGITQTDNPQVERLLHFHRVGLGV